MKYINTDPANGKQDDEQLRVWETNHAKILEAIDEITKYVGSHVPTITEIAKATGLSRQTIYQHFKNSTEHPAQQQRTEMFESLETEILMQVCRQAMRGNLKAAKLYLELRGKIQPKDSTNNYIKVNDMVLNQQVIQNLDASQLQKIEEIIRSANLVYQVDPTKFSEDSGG